ncbi:hypothetical protein Cni_G26709 [Canna indica]|uniref:Uncharacterized protein n=1 Tax=Canna indica TaxID=4628 RepID=A0AAQ3QMB0_9LILI|nr:hypothetical protein Cni_G26709 [Canna indica]
MLRRLTNSKEEAERRLEEIKTTVGIDKACDGDVVQASGKHRGEGVWRDLLLQPTPTVRRVLTAAIGVHFFQHATGIEVVVLYNPQIFKKVGLVTKNQQFLATIGVGVVKTAFILLAILLVDKVGRRKLFLLSIIGMIAHRGGRRPHGAGGVGVVLTAREGTARAGRARS